MTGQQRASEENNNSSSAALIGGIVGGVVGLLCIIGVIGAVVIVLGRRQRARSAEPTVPQPQRSRRDSFSSPTTTIIYDVIPEVTAPTNFLAVYDGDDSESI
jgi:hypothetical protein